MDSHLPEADYRQGVYGRRQAGEEEGCKHVRLRGTAFATRVYGVAYIRTAGFGPNIN